MTYPKITIITPSYNQGQFLEETIRSVLLQNYPNLEYIVIDGGSTDNSVEIIKKYEKWIDYWVSEPDRGQAHAINKGLEIATGEVFNWLNSDDWYVEGALEKVGRSFAEKKFLKCLLAVTTMVDNYRFVRNYQTALLSSMEGTAARMDIAQPCSFFSTSAFEDFLFEDMHYMFDAEMWIRFILHHGQENIITVPDVVAFYRLHSYSKTVKMSRKFREDRIILLYILGYLCDYSPSVHPEFSIPNRGNIEFLLSRWATVKTKSVDGAKLRMEIYQSYFDLALQDKKYRLVLFYFVRTRGYLVLKNLSKIIRAATPNQLVDLLKKMITWRN